jgi:hypothetical protein
MGRGARDGRVFFCLEVDFVLLALLDDFREVVFEAGWLLRVLLFFLLLDFDLGLLVLRAIL